MQEQHAKGDTSARGGGRNGELVTISHKFSFPPWKLQETAKHENCHQKQEMCQPLSVTSIRLS